jgi:hypothetical protein
MGGLIMMDDSWIIETINIPTKMCCNHQMAKLGEKKMGGEARGRANIERSTICSFLFKYSGKHLIWSPDNKLNASSNTLCIEILILGFFFPFCEVEKTRIHVKKKTI